MRNSQKYSDKKADRNKLYEAIRQFTEPSAREARSVQDLGSLDRAHLFLLSRFLAVSSGDQFRDDRWGDVLGEPPKRVIYRFIEAGLIEEVSVVENLVLSHSATELRTVLKGAGLARSGSKAEMARRLASQRPGEAGEKVANTAAFLCTKRGRELAEAALAGYRKEREDAEVAALEALTRGDLRRAASAVVRFEARQVFPRGIGVRWDASEIGRLSEQLWQLNRARPGILSDLFIFCGLYCRYVILLRPYFRVSYGSPEISGHECLLSQAAGTRPRS